MKKILLIEDNKDISNNIKDYLEIHNFEVNQIYNWELWLSEALNKNYDLVLLDIWLPKTNWFIICQKLREKNDIPIIFITAREFIEDKIFWLKLWANDYIVKPFDLRELLARIEIHLKNKNKISDIFTKNDINLDFENRLFKKWEIEIILTQKEIDILKIIIENWEKISSRTYLIEQMWWDKWLFNSDWKLDVYISNLRSKFGKDFIKTVKWIWYKM